MTDIEVLAAELARRDRIVENLFEAQRAAVDDASRKKVYKTTRRAGKTYAMISELVDDAIKNARCMYPFISLARHSAENIAWPILKELNEKYDLGCEFQEAKLRAKFPNGSMITLYGADKPGWGTKLYGGKYKKVAIDEAAFFSVDLDDLVADVLWPALSDHQGTLIMASIPGFVPRGYFWNAWNDESGEWSKHEWTAFDNPYMKEQFDADIEAARKTNPDIEEDPKFRRNYLGEWVLADGERVYRYHPEHRVFEFEPDDTTRYVLGVDLGFFDATAFSIIAYSENREDVVEVECFAQSEMSIDQIAAQINMYRGQYAGLVMTGDPSRRQAFEELSRRHGLPLLPAVRTDKESWIEIINSDMAMGFAKFLHPHCEDHIAQMMELSWEIRPTGKRIENARVKNDICDAYLYAYRYSYHYRGSRPAVEPKIGTKEYVEREMARIEQRLADEIDEENNQEWWDR